MQLLKLAISLQNNKQWITESLGKWGVVAGFNTSGRCLSEHGGSDVSAANVATCSTWSGRVESKRPNATSVVRSLFWLVLRLAQQKRRKRIRLICFTGSGDCFVRPHRLFFNWKSIKHVWYLWFWIREAGRRIGASSHPACNHRWRLKSISWLFFFFSLFQVRFCLKRTRSLLFFSSLGPAGFWWYQGWTRDRLWDVWWTRKHHVSRK